MCNSNVSAHPTLKKKKWYVVSIGLTVYVFVGLAGRADVPDYTLPGQ